MPTYQNLSYFEADRPSAAYWPGARRNLANTASGETVWGWIALAFAAYWAFFIVGAYSGKQELNDIGAIFILAALAWATMERLWVKLDAVAICCLVAGAVPAMGAFGPDGNQHATSIVKWASLCVVMALTRLLRLPPSWSSKMRWAMVAQILLVLGLSVTFDRGGVWDGGTRHSGLFANPNNLALIPFLLLFFIDRRRDSAFLQAAFHLVVIGVLAWTGTSGAVMAYGIGLAIHFQALMPRSWRVPLFALGGCGLVTALVFAGLAGGNLLPETRLTKQIAVMGKELNTVMDGGEVAYYAQEKVLGPGAASGIWRLVHWRRTLTTYLNGTPEEHFLGMGVGSSPDLMGKLPHNEYIRMLFEQGLLGLGLFLFAWARIIGTAPKDIRYVGIILAIYSFSENNLDNFPFMALFTICLSSIDPLDGGAEAAQRA